MVGGWAEYIKPFVQLCDDRVAKAKQWQEENKGGVMGYVCNYIPEEIIIAAGFLPYRLTSRIMPIEEADAYLFNFYCSLARICFEMGLKGEFEFLDGVIFTYSCDTMRGLFDIWKENIKHKFPYFLVSPVQNNPEAEEFFIHELYELLAGLAKLTGKEITGSALQAAIAQCNENKRLLQNVDALRTGEHPLISGAEFHQIVMSGLVSPKARHNQLLTALQAGLPAQRPELEHRPRVIVSGSGLDNVELLRLIESSGILVAADDLCFGSRYCDTLVEETGDPVEAIARRYLSKGHCPCRCAMEQDYRGVVARFKQLKLDGFIFATQKFCELSLYEYPVFREEMEKAGFPILYLEVENTPGGVEALRTRVQAFAEILGSGK
jgi:bzd-type benzoyl-CoA reductase N subunit